MFIVFLKTVVFGLGAQVDDRWPGSRFMYVRYRVAAARVLSTSDTDTAGLRASYSTPVSIYDMHAYLYFIKSLFPQNIKVGLGFIVI
jgi:hypothetical protein